MTFRQFFAAARAAAIAEAGDDAVRMGVPRSKVSEGIDTETPKMTGKQADALLRYALKGGK